MAWTKQRCDLYFRSVNALAEPTYKGFDSKLIGPCIEMAKMALALEVTSYGEITSAGSEVSTALAQERELSIGVYQKPMTEWAVYEQVFHILVNAEHVANGELTGPKWISRRTSLRDGEPFNPMRLSDRAKDLLGWESGILTWVRG